MDEVFVGRTLDGDAVAVPNSARTGHVQIVGATGRGKTESVILPWLLQDIIHERPVILIDGKGDRGILERVEETSLRRNIKGDKIAWLDLGRLDKSFVTNPLLYGSAQQVTDRLFSAFEFESEYFRAVAYEATLLLVRLLHAAGEKASFRRIAELFRDGESLAKLLGSLPRGKHPAIEQGVAKLLRLPEKDRSERFSGLLAQIAPFADGEVGEIVNASGEEIHFFSLTEIISPEVNPEARKRRAALVLIPELLYQDTARRLGKILLQEVAWAVGHREASSHRDFTALFLDEFGSFVYAGFLGLLNKARSTNTAIHLSHQSIGDIQAVSPEFATALHTNTNVKCILGVNDPDSADFFAKHFGTRSAEKVTERAQKKGWFSAHERTGEMSLRDVKEYRIDPDSLRHYSKGRGVLSFLVDGFPFAEEIQFARAPF